MKEQHRKKKGSGQKCYAFPNKSTPSMPIVIDETRCIGCNKCVDICMMDLLVPNPEKGGPPIILYPEECYREGDCVTECPKQGAITFRHPLMNRAHYKDKETGEIRRT
jgi:NAD-dependent dihydropyrimidine dehydrogenase PreA subunit